MGRPSMAAPRFWNFWPDPWFWRVTLSTFLGGVVNCGQVETAMSTEALNRIIKEVNALTPQERRELIDQLTHEEQNSQEQIVRKPGTLKGTVKYMAPDFDDSALSSLSTHEVEITADNATLREWLNEARNMRAELSLTSDSVDILRELREVRSRQ
jgi:hypothetical protein